MSEEKSIEIESLARAICKARKIDPDIACHGTVNGPPMMNGPLLVVYGQIAPAWTFFVGEAAWLAKELELEIDLDVDGGYWINPKSTVEWTLVEKVK